MPVLLIQDFLQTQGLKLSSDDLRVAYLTAKTVMDMGNAAIDRSVLWREEDGWKLADHIEETPENEVLLKQVFMALDSVFSRATAVKSAAVYIHIPGEPHARLVRISAQGEPLENLLAVHEENGTVYLACRTAQSGWMNIANDIAYWLSLDEIQGDRNKGSGSQLSIPVATQNGTVLGVVHVEFTDKDQADEAAQTDWSALALALAEPLKALVGIEDKEEEHE